MWCGGGAKKRNVRTTDIHNTFDSVARTEQGGAAKVLRDGAKGARKTYGSLPRLVSARQLWKAEKGKGMVFQLFPDIS